MENTFGEERDELIKRLNEAMSEFNKEAIKTMTEMFDRLGYDVVKREPELKACPVCGMNQIEKHTDKNKWNYIYCGDCTIRTAGFECMEHAIEAWNALPRKDAQ